MITPIFNITLKDAEKLRCMPLGTNGRSVCITDQEIADMQKHLSSNVYKGEGNGSVCRKDCSGK